MQQARSRSAVVDLIYHGETALYSLDKPKNLSGKKGEQMPKFLIPHHISLVAAPANLECESIMNHASQILFE